ncbi:Crp/Fnr family transcriptional regulator [Pseudonocardia acaciae]|uniref:Crp/Fnr family transcriptional regulator n=1 Tax=Pseudonocardia acaciae TaxID=551276 RepID=UPI000490D6A2|nr:Crp/Fnr family transcriptional regulator [Pseudonocardia acaciae]
MDSGGNFNLSVPALGALEPLGRGVMYRKGRQLIRQGEEGDCVIVLRTGFVKIMSHTSAGSVRLLGVCGPGALLGEMACIDDRPRSASVVAGGPLSGVKIARSQFLGYLGEFPRVAFEVVRQVSVRLRTSETHHMALLAHDVDTRVLRVLVHVGEFFARLDGRYPVTIPLNQEELSQMAAASVGSVQRSLRDLRERSVVETRYGRLVLPCTDRVRRALPSENFAQPTTRCFCRACRPSS